MATMIWWKGSRQDKSLLILKGDSRDRRLLSHGACFAGHR